MYDKFIYQYKLKTKYIVLLIVINVENIQIGVDCQSMNISNVS